MKATILLGRGDVARGDGDVEVGITLEGGRLSLVGSVWQLSRRDINSGGQNQDSIVASIKTFRVPREQVERLVAVWDRWHLNDMRAGCEHQREWDTSRKVEVISYTITYEAQGLRNSTRDRLTEAALEGGAAVDALRASLTPTEHALIALDDWFKDRFVLPDADSPLAGCFKEKKRDMKYIGQTYPSEHPEGVLTKPCAVCGYKYGSSWLREELPADVIEFINTFVQTYSPASPKA